MAVQSRFIAAKSSILSETLCIRYIPTVQVLLFMQWTIIDGIISGEAEELARSLLLVSNRCEEIVDSANLHFLPEARKSFQ